MGAGGRLSCAYRVYDMAVASMPSAAIGIRNVFEWDAGSLKWCRCTVKRLRRYVEKLYRRMSNNNHCCSVVLNLRSIFELVQFMRSSTKQSSLCITGVKS